MARKKKYMGDSGGFKTITLMKDCNLRGGFHKAGKRLSVTPDFLKELKDGGYLDAPKKEIINHKK